jgi:branched-chain amino acid transport system permease protein
VLFASQTFSGGLSGVYFTRPGYLLSPRVYYLAGAAVFALAAVGVQNLRRSKTGLALGAMRDSEVALGSLGVDVARLKLTAFSVSALLAGMGGALFAASDGLAKPFDFYKFQSLQWLALAVIGGIGNWIGAVAGAVVMLLVPSFVHERFVQENVVSRTIFGGELEALLPVFFGLGAIALARNPHGLAEQIRSWIAREGREPTSPPIPPLEKAVPDDRLVAVAGGTLLHRADCVLVRDKKHVRTKKSLAPCPVCDPVG